MRRMRAWFALIAAAVLVVLVTTSGTIGTVMAKGIPIKELGDGKPHPEILLIEPLPGWIRLPDSGSAISAGVYPPQPPYGAAAVIMVMTDDFSADFAADYGRRLERAGFFGAAHSDPIPSDHRQAGRSVQGGRT